MSRTRAFDWVTEQTGTPQEQDVITVNQIPFAAIWREPDGERLHYVFAYADSRRGAEIGKRGSRHSAFELAMVYAERNGLG